MRDPQQSRAVEGQPLEIERPSRRRHWVVFLLCTMYLITYMDRTNLSIAAPLISTEFHFDKITMGVIFSAFSWSYAAFQIPCGALGDRFGARRILGVFVLYWSALTTAMVAAGSATTFWLARFFFGIGEAGAFPTATRAMTHWVPASERGMAQGLTHSFSRLGAAITPLITVWITTRWGWRGAFWLFGLLGTAWAVTWLVSYRDLPQEDKRVNSAEMAIIRPDGDVGGLRSPARWTALLKSRNMWAINLQYFAYGYSLWFYLTWLPTYFVDVRHFSYPKTGLYTSLPFLTGMAGDTLGGWLCDYLGKRTGSLRLSRAGVGAFAMMAAVVFLIPGAVTGQARLAVVYLSVAFFFLEMNIGPAWAVVMDVGHENAGAVSGMMNMCGSFAGALSPIIFAAAWQKTGSVIVPFFISGALMAVGALAWLFVDPKQAVFDS
jgi:sugar phosphate permease